jgi:hypothetical protein
MTDSGLPPTPTHVFSRPCSTGGKTSWSVRGGRSSPLQVTGLLRQQCREQVELLLEELLVLVELEAEEGERLDERPAPQDDLGAAARQSVERREALEHPHGVVGAQDGHGRTEVDALGAPGDRAEHHFGRRDRELVPVVLADPEEVESEPIGEHGLLHHVPQHLGVRQRRAVGPGGHVAEGVESEFVALSHVLPHPRVSIRTHALAEPASGRDYSQARWWGQRRRMPRRAVARGGVRAASRPFGAVRRGNAPVARGVGG